MSPQRQAVCHPEFLEDLQHWIETDRRTARRLLELMKAVPSLASVNRSLSKSWARASVRVGSPRSTAVSIWSKLTM